MSDNATPSSHEREKTASWNTRNGANTLVCCLETVVVFLVLLALPLKAVIPIAVVAATFATVTDIEAGVHLRERVHAQNLVDLSEGQ